MNFVLNLLAYPATWWALSIVGLTLFFFYLGSVLIQEREVGIVVKRYGPSLLPGRLIALAGEAGYQADTLAPGLHFGYWPWKFRIIKAPVTIVSQGEIALVMAADGEPIPRSSRMGRMAARTVARVTFRTQPVS
jgi:uncharacterized membrane protein YqiK